MRRRRSPSADPMCSRRSHLGVHLAHRAGRIGDHDATIGRKLAWILAGGNVPHATDVSEAYLLDLEREAFLSLCGEPKTQERIAYTLKTGKTHEELMVIAGQGPTLLLIPGIQGRWEWAKPAVRGPRAAPSRGELLAVWRASGGAATRGTVVRRPRAPGAQCAQSRHRRPGRRLRRLVWRADRIAAGGPPSRSGAGAGAGLAAERGLLAGRTHAALGGASAPERAGVPGRVARTNRPGVAGRARSGAGCRARSACWAGSCGRRIRPIGWPSGCD